MSSKSPATQQTDTSNLQALDVHCQAASQRQKHDDVTEPKLSRWPSLPTLADRLLELQVSIIFLTDQSKRYKARKMRTF